LEVDKKMKWWTFLMVGLSIGILVSMIVTDTPKALLSSVVSVITDFLLLFLTFWVVIGLMSSGPKAGLRSARNSFLLVAGYFVAASFFRLI
jgi:hypothetical protein